jgi:hypothetical protein
MENLKNVALHHLVDEMGYVKAQIAELEARAKALREVFLATAETSGVGDAYQVERTDAVRWTLKSKDVRAEMGDAWWNARCATATVTTLMIRPRAIEVSMRNAA